MVSFRHTLRCVLLHVALRFAGKTLLVFLVAQRSAVTQAQRMCERPLGLYRCETKLASISLFVCSPYVFFYVNGE